MTTRIDPERQISDMTLLHPSAVKQFSQLAEKLIFAHRDKDTPTLFLPFETYRTPHRQRMLFQSGKGVTKAGPYQSSHQYGLAVDFVPWDNKFSWDQQHDWDFLRVTAEQFGLWRPYKWDLAHIEHPRFDWLRHDVTRL